MLLRLNRGEHARIQVPFKFLKSKDRNYRIRGVVDVVSGVTCRTVPEGWGIQL